MRKLLCMWWVLCCVCVGGGVERVVSGGGGGGQWRIRGWVLYTTLLRGFLPCQLENSYGLFRRPFRGPWTPLEEFLPWPPPPPPLKNSWIRPWVRACVGVYVVCLCLTGAHGCRSQAGGCWLIEKHLAPKLVQRDVLRSHFYGRASHRPCPRPPPSLVHDWCVVSRKLFLFVYRCTSNRSECTPFSGLVGSRGIDYLCVPGLQSLWFASMQALLVLLCYIHISLFRTYWPTSGVCRWSSTPLRVSSCPGRWWWRPFTSSYYGS